MAAGRAPGPVAPVLPPPHAGEVRYPVDPALLERIVRAEVQAVERHAGGTSASEVHVNRHPLPQILNLVRPAAAISSVTERWHVGDFPIVLDSTDYRALDRWRLARTPDGPNPAYTWGREVEVIYTPEVDQELRERVVLDLVALSAAFRTYNRLQVGSDAISIVNTDHAARPRELLGQITEGRALVL